MSKKKIVSELLLTTTENLADEFLFKTANTFLEDAIKSIPFASLITSSIQSYAKFRTFKEQKQLLAFIQEAENTDHEFIERFFNDKSNIELGFEILGILDQTYLEHQARTLFRATKLFKDTQIIKHEFDKFTYIITRLNNHLVTLIEELKNSFDEASDDKIISIPLPNMEMISFGFIKKTSEQFTFSEAAPKVRNGYHIEPEFSLFYENIFRD